VKTRKKYHLADEPAAKSTRKDHDSGTPSCKSRPNFIYLELQRVSGGHTAVCMYTGNKTGLTMPAERQSMPEK
jgi:hypothetical protein